MSNVELVASEGSEFTSVTVADGVVLYVDGSAEEVPFAWFMGGEFAFRVELGGVCDGCGSPVWKAEFFRRSVNGPGSEMISVHAAVSELAAGVEDVSSVAVMVAAAFGSGLVHSLDPAVVAFGAALGLDAARLVVWVAEVVYAVEPLVRPSFEEDRAAEAFMSVPLDEI